MTSDPNLGTQPEEHLSTEARVASLAATVASLQTELAETREFLLQIRGRNNFLLHKQIDLEFELFLLDRRLKEQIKTPTER
ncbi:MAG TPA: hypothetical protein VK191_17670 [Symbiobacteriaceae bacterium]|nr:hypothetical protein [Symbiobacteriaceae bacterium]